MMRPKHGFLLGKFLPPHAGHAFLCEFAKAHCDHLTVLVCSIEAEPIDGAIRFQWMRELLPDVRVLHCNEDLPQEPADHPDFWAIWRGVMHRYHPEPIDAVYASEAYGARLAMAADAAFVPVDPGRLAQPVSGTMLRADPLKHWERLIAPARRDCTRVISLHGPESTGKTTLARQLAAHYRTSLAPEYGRTYTETFGTECTSDDLVRIGRGQSAAIEAAKSTARGFVVTDTDAVMTAVWSDMLTGSRDPWFTTCQVSDFYLVTRTDIGWADDGTRYFPDDPLRSEFLDRSIAELESRGLPLAMVEGAGEDRLASAIAALDTQLAPGFFLPFKPV